MTDSRQKTRWYVITGAPASGKSTVVRALQDLGYRVGPEVARDYIEQEMGKGRTIDDIRGDEIRFQKDLLSLKAQAELDLPPDSQIILDRALPDSITYYRLLGLDVADVIAVCNRHQYAQVFVFDRLTSIEDPIRTEDEASMAFLDKGIEKDYSDLGYDIIRVPPLSIEERVQFVLDHITHVK